MTKGVELFIQIDAPMTSGKNLSIFTAAAFMNGIYKTASLPSGKTNITVSGNKIESVPSWQSRNVVLSARSCTSPGIWPPEGRPYSATLRFLTGSKAE